MAAEIPQPDPNQPRAEAAGRLVSELNYTQEQVGKVLGKKLSTVSEILSLNRLPAVIRDECRINPACPRRVLVEIARKKQERGMLTLYEKYKAKGLTSDEIREEIKKERQQPGPAEQAAAILTGIAALHTRVDKADWQAFSIEDRSQIKEAFMALYDTLDAIPENSGKQPA
jgi:ParB family chromosome partitioning protein